MNEMMVSRVGAVRADLPEKLPRSEQVKRGFAYLQLAVVLPLITLFVLSSACVVLAVRGPAYVAWYRPEHFCRLLDWLAFEWDYRDVCGARRGLRAFGLEVAYNGRLIGR